MVKNKTPYPIIQSSEIQSLEQIKLVPESQLDPLTQAELSNLRAGVPYKFTIADTPENRENFNFKAIYFQMVAYKEGWKFKPENLQVVYVSPSDRVFPETGYQSRILELTAWSANKDIGLQYKISPESRLCFKVGEKNSDFVEQMTPDEADDLGAKVINLFKC